MTLRPFVAWDPCAVKNGAVLQNLQGVDRTFALRDGESFAGRFPASAHFQFDPDFKRDTLPVDCFINVNGFMVCSDQAAEFIRGQAPEAVEYLPVRILDHKGKPLSGRHWIVHPLGVFDCIDIARSRVTWSAFDAASIDEFEHLEFDASRVPAQHQMFRAKGCPSLLLLRRPFAEAMVQQGLTGADWREID